MRPKQLIKIVTDIMMIVLLILLTACSLVGKQAHGWPENGWGTF